MAASKKANLGKTNRNKTSKANTGTNSGRTNTHKGNTDKSSLTNKNKTRANKTSTNKVQSEKNGTGETKEQKKKACRSEKTEKVLQFPRKKQKQKRNLNFIQRFFFGF